MKKSRGKTTPALALALMLALCIMTAPGCSKGSDAGADKNAAADKNTSSPTAENIVEKKTETQEDTIEDKKKAARDALEEALKLIESDNPEDIQKGMDSARKAVDLDPDFARPYCALGTANRKLGSYEEALKWYEKAIALDQQYVVCYDNMGYAQYLIGVKALENEDMDSAQSAFDEAEAAFSKAIELDATYADAYFNIGQLYQIAYDNPELAIEYFTRYVELSSDEVKKNEVKDWIRQLQ
jgi:tetratricopeptide (TPR) repeat protein